MTADADQYEILVVDDTREILKFLSRMLEKRGYLVRTASHGSLALQSVASRLPDLILLDVEIPEMDGYEVCRRLKSDDRSRKVPVIFISGRHETIDKVKGFKSGGVDYITKPFESEELIARIETHLQLKKQTACLEQKMRECIKELTVVKEAAGIAKSQYLSKMSHELPTHLNPVVGYARILKKQNILASDQKEDLQNVCESCAKLIALFSDIKKRIYPDEN